MKQTTLKVVLSIHTDECRIDTVDDAVSCVEEAVEPSCHICMHRLPSTHKGNIINSWQGICEIYQAYCSNLDACKYYEYDYKKHHKSDYLPKRNRKRKSVEF